MSDTLKNKSTGDYYVVARSERCVKAFDREQKLLWKVNPWKSKDLIQLVKSNWGSPDPDSVSIRTIEFPKTEYMGGGGSIVVYFGDRIVGTIDKKTGEFVIRGQN